MPDQNSFQPKGAMSLNVRAAGPSLGNGGVFGQNQSAPAQLSPVPSPAPAQMQAQIGQSNAPKGAQPVQLMGGTPALGANPVGGPNNTPSRSPAVGRQGAFQAGPGTFTPAPQGPFQHTLNGTPASPKLPQAPKPSMGAPAAPSPVQSGNQLHVIEVELRTPDNKIFKAPFEIEAPRGSKVMGVSERVQ